MKNICLCLLVAVLSVTIFAGCSSDKSNETGAKGTVQEQAKGTAGKAKINTDPITLTVFVMPALDDSTLKTMIEEPIQKKYPFISFKYVSTTTERRIRMK